MCGRYALILSAGRLAEVFAAEVGHELAPRYNIAPTQQAPIVRRRADGSREIALAQWGLVPGWAKDPKIGARLINARSETVASKPSFRSAVRRRRCLVPASGFFEWQQTAGGKEPYYIHPTTDVPFAFAGLWESSATSPTGPLETFTILTTAPNELVAKIHARMPVILPPERHAEWLEPVQLTVERLAEILVPHPALSMAAHQVSRRVNRPAHDEPTCIEPLDGNASTGILPFHNAH